MRLAAPLLLTILLGCGGQPHSQEGFAPTQLFFFEVVCLHPGPDCLAAKQLIEQELPKYKYTFTPGSSRTWPYYQAFPLDADVPPDTLLPPHTRLHQLIPYQEKTLFGPSAESLVSIRLYTVNDSIPDYEVNIFRLENGRQEKTGTSGPQRATQRPGMTLSTPEILLKSVIRFSFK